MFSKNFLIYWGDAAGRNWTFAGFHGDHGFVPVDELVRAVAHLFPSTAQEADMEIFQAGMVVKTPFGYARVMTSKDPSGIVVVKDTKLGTVYAINAEDCTLPPPRPPQTAAELRRDLRRAKRELARQQAALVKRKSVARYQAKRIREAKRSLQIAVEGLTAIKPLPNVPLTALARIVAEEAEKQRGIRVGDTVQHYWNPACRGTVMDICEPYIQIRPLERGTPTYWATRASYSRYVEGVS